MCVTSVIVLFIISLYFTKHYKCLQNNKNDKHLKLLQTFHACRNSVIVPFFRRNVMVIYNGTTALSGWLYDLIKTLKLYSGIKWVNHRKIDVIGVLIIHPHVFTIQSGTRAPFG